MRFTRVKGLHNCEGKMPLLKACPLQRQHQAALLLSHPKNTFFPSRGILKAVCTVHMWGPTLHCCRRCCGVRTCPGAAMEQPCRKPSSCMCSPSSGSGFWLLNPCSSNGLSSSLEALRAGHACHGTSAWWCGWWPWLWASPRSDVPSTSIILLELNIHPSREKKIHQVKINSLLDWLKAHLHKWELY